MKKLFTLALALLVATAGYSQVRKMSKNDAKNKVATMQVTKGMESFENVQSEPNMTRTDGELDYTFYDWQTNAGPINRTIVWPDGKINFAYTIAGDASYSDRGTGIGTYDSEADEWIPSGGRIENVKTGFGSIARYKDNGIVIAAHTATQCGVFILEDRNDLAAAQGTLSPVSFFDPTIDPTWPVVMTSGANRDIIHVLATGYSDSKIYYFRSLDGGLTWDKSNVVLPFFTEEYGSDWGSNVAYWMETTEDNCLAYIVNNAWSDCMYCYSYDDGETWERKVFWHHPGINTTFDTWFMYPRWASAQYGVNGELCIAYELNGSTGEPGSGSYYPGLAGVAFWSESMPYHGEAQPEWGVDPTNPKPMQPGEPFIMDSAYIHQDIRDSWWIWGDEASHMMWDEFIGYLPALTPEGQPEPDPYNVTEFNITDLSLHGTYNSGCVAMPALATVPGSNGSAMAAVWCCMDENNMDGNSNYYYKLFASVTEDGGRTWWPQIQLTTDFMYELTEFAYPQAAVIGTTLVVAVQADAETGTYVQEDDATPDDNFYQGFTFELPELFPGFDAVEEVVSHNTHMNLYPNPAVDQLNVTLSQNANVVIYNIMGQAVMNLEGHAGANTFDISNLNAGVYFISAGSDTQKFIVK